MTGIRNFPDDPGEAEARRRDGMLRANQESFIRNNSDFLDELAALFAPLLSEYLGIEEECQRHYADEHAKKALRIASFWELIASGDYESLHWCRKVLYKCKADEVAKVGKFIRMIADLGCPASLLGFRLAHYMKEAMAKHDIETVNGRYRAKFIKSPKHEGLMEAYEFLQLQSGCDVAMVYFSDDSCIAVRGEDGFRIYNMDISSCDASHTESLFKALIQVTPAIARKDMARLVGQCRIPIDIVDQSAARSKKKVRLKPKESRLYSGVTVTTLVNNLATVLMFRSISTSGACDEKTIILAAAAVGYIVTLEACPRIQDIQFLKHSFFYDVNDKIVPVLNFGVLLRSFGQVAGDLPGRKSEGIENRINGFITSHLRSTYPNTTVPLLTTMASRFSATPLLEKTEKAINKIVLKSLDYKVVKSTMQSVLTNNSFLERYDLDPSEYQELIDVIGQMAIGQRICLRATSKIFKKDYGLTCDFVQAIPRRVHREDLVGYNYRPRAYHGFVSVNSTRRIIR